MPGDAEVNAEASSVIVRHRKGRSFVFRTSTPRAGVSLADPEPLAEGLVRRLLTVEANESLTFEIGFGAKQGP